MEDTVPAHGRVPIQRKGHAEGRGQGQVRGKKQSKSFVFCSTDFLGSNYFMKSW